MPRTEYVTAATIRRGKLTVLNPARWTAAMREFTDGAVLASVKVPQRVRSPEANAFYWSQVIRPLADYTGYDPYTVHSYCKTRFLEPTRIVIADAAGVVEDDRAIAQPTTTTLTPSAFSAFVEAIQAWAAELGVVVRRDVS